MQNIINYPELFFQLITEMVLKIKAVSTNVRLVKDDEGKISIPIFPKLRLSKQSALKSCDLK